MVLDLETVVSQNHGKRILYQRGRFGIRISEIVQTKPVLSKTDG